MGDRDLSTLKPHERGMGIIFQSYALFPNMTVLENVSYALTFKMSKQEAEKNSNRNFGSNWNGI